MTNKWEKKKKPNKSQSFKPKNNLFWTSQIKRKSTQFNITLDIVSLSKLCTKQCLSSLFLCKMSERIWLKKSMTSFLSYCSVVLLFIRKLVCQLNILIKSKNWPHKTFWLILSPMNHCVTVPTSPFLTSSWETVWLES